MEKYEGSICQATVNSSTLEQLKIRRVYHENAIREWENKGDIGEVQFFKESLFHVDLRINQLQKK